MKTRELTKDERNEQDVAFDLDCELAHKIIEKYQPGYTGDFSSEILDGVIECWLNDPAAVIDAAYDQDYSSDNSKKPTEKMIVYAFGTAFGAYLIYKYKGKWVFLLHDNGNKYMAVECSGRVFLIYDIMWDNIRSGKKGFLVSAEAIMNRPIPIST